MIPIRRHRSHEPAPALSPGVPRLQQSKKNRSLAEKFTALKARRNWFPDRHSRAVSYFRKNNILFPSPSRVSDANPSISQPAQARDPVLNVAREIQNCLMDNFNIG
jgi:hypothetical protein